MIGISDKKFYNWLVIAILIPILYYINYPGRIVAVSIMSNGLILYLLFKRYRIGKLTHLSNILPLKFLFYVMLFGIAKSFFFPNSDDIETKDLIMSLFGIAPLFLALTIYDVNCVKSYFYSVLIFYSIAAVYSFLKWHGFLFYDVSHILLPITLVLAMFPYTNKKCRIFIISLLLFGTFADLSVRACLVIYGLSFMVLAGSVLFGNKKFDNIVRYVGILMFVSPIILFGLAITNNYNIFESIENIKVQTSIGANKERDNVMIDTRTGVYRDALLSTEKYDEIFLGQGIGVRIQTFSFPEGSDEAFYGRKSVEVGIMNAYIRYGLLGVLIVILVFCMAFYNAAFKSNNVFMKFVASFIAIRYLSLFFETPELTPDIYMSIGICFSDKVRNISDEDMKKVFM